MNEFDFPLETATSNQMTSPFDREQVPESLKPNVWHPGVIEVLQLRTHEESGDIYFSFKFRPDDSESAVFDTRLNLWAGSPKDGGAPGFHRMAGETIKFVAAMIGGSIKNRRLTTASGETSEEAIAAACDGAVRRPCEIMVKPENKGYINMKDVRLV